MSDDNDDDSYGGYDYGNNDSDDAYDPYGEYGGENDDGAFCGGEEGGDAEENGNEASDDDEIKPIVWKYNRCVGTYDAEMIYEHILEERIRKTICGATRSEKIALLRSVNWKVVSLGNNYFDNTDTFRKRAGLLHDDEDIEDVYASSTEEYRKVPEGKDPDDEIECVVTLDDTPLKDTWILPGNGRISTDALSAMLKTSIDNDGKQVLFKRFPNGFGQTIPAVFFEAEGPLDDAYKKKYVTRSVDHFVECDRGFRFCTGPNCKLYLSRPATSSAERGEEIKERGGGGGATKTNEEDAEIDMTARCELVRCGGCSTEMCFNCGESRHTPCSCDVVRKWNEKGKDTDANAIWLELNTKPCPHCGKRANQDRGCLKMTCANCGGRFCWKCLSKTPEICSKGDGAYRCEASSRNRAKRRNSGKTPAGKDTSDRAKLKEKLRADEYSETFSKYLGFISNARDANKDLRTDAETIKKAVESSDSIAVSDRDLAYLTEAVEEARLGALANAYTWIYRYFEYDDPDDELEYVRETRILDHSQSSLEACVGNIFEIVRKGTDDSIAESQAKYDTFSKKVKRYLESARTFRESLMADIENGFPDIRGTEDKSLARQRATEWKYAKVWLESKHLDTFGRPEGKHLPETCLKPTKRRHKGAAQWVLKLVKLQRDFPGRPWEDLIPRKVFPKESVWWWDSDGAWTPFSDHVIDAIEKTKASRGGSTSVEVNSAGRNYRIDWKHMTQTNLQTGGSRRLRMTMENPTRRDWCCDSCGYRNKGGEKNIRACEECGQSRARHYKLW